MAKARRTPAQIAAAKRNLEKARAARKKAAQRDPKRFTKALAKRRKDQAKAEGSSETLVKINAKKTRQERVGGRAWAAKEAGGTVPLSSFRPGSRVRVSARTGRTFTQTRRQAIMGIRVYDKPKTRRRRK